MPQQRASKMSAAVTSERGSVRLSYGGLVQFSVLLKSVLSGSQRIRGKSESCEPASCFPKRNVTAALAVKL